MAYADAAGFRLGTSRPVYWINPATHTLSRLTLHPLTLMDVTLSEQKYMGLGYEEALGCALRLMEQVRQFNGELTLLWHNTSVVNGAGYQRELYAHLLTKIR
jgi:hypothetical protein